MFSSFNELYHENKTLVKVLEQRFEFKSPYWRARYCQNVEQIILH